MTRMLASVVDVEEALLALGGGADLIDCKDPRRGALGALPTATIVAILSAVNGRRPVSATVGDLPTDADALLPAIGRIGKTGVDFVKIGIFQPDALAAQLPALAVSASAFRLIAVLFADRGLDLSLVSRLATAGFAGVMLDTADKTSGNLLDHLPVPLTAEFVVTAHRCGLLAGLAGSLRRGQIPALLGGGADYLGFRGALCDGRRTGRLSAQALQDIRALIADSDAHPMARNVA